ncbi:GNAT family N-acetyltransferase [Aquitalea sp. LB_tupeE]|uniref:GNAT family N-acetyltransferase n=1 Tax=Aquitalea sp. LB_tupeE TaxID=2748078 RepID=UPI0015C0F4E2|nr:GNAT family N-acetyltransferase [Aquitalea sp. LB_tupeE]NWK79997.1 GNAT family N-acetyltransferase [Aquitalea sp. LB_tupeE]
MPVIRLMTLDDYPTVLQLMQQTPGISIRDADSEDATARYLTRNPGLSFVAEVDGNIVGCVMSGHDGRRGYLQHLLVLPAYRRQGLARRLVDACITELARQGIAKTHLDVFRSNTAAQSFWENQGWQRREDICRYSFISSGNSLA